MTAQRLKKWASHSREYAVVTVSGKRHALVSNFSMDLSRNHEPSTFTGPQKFCLPSPQLRLGGFETQTQAPRALDICLSAMVGRSYGRGFPRLPVLISKLGSSPAQIRPIYARTRGGMRRHGSAQSISSTFRNRPGSTGSAESIALRSRES